jgi:hypothetical protein
MGRRDEIVAGMRAGGGGDGGVDLVGGRDFRCETTRRRDVRERGRCGAEGGGSAA